MLFLLEKPAKQLSKFAEGWGETAKSRRGATPPEHALAGA
jgi:hypothetical protein